MDFSIPKHVHDIAHRVRQFVDTEVVPIEQELLQTGQELDHAILQDLRARAKSADLLGSDHAKRMGWDGTQYPRDRPCI